MYDELRKLASSCGHLGQDSSHRFALFNLDVMPVGMIESVRVGRLGIRMEAGADIRAAVDALLWEDEHCAYCCGAMLRVVGLNPIGLLMRCGPTIEPSNWTPAGAIDVVGSITDEYWTD